MAQLFEVYKHPAPFNGREWAVKLPHGIEAYRTKGKASQVSDDYREAAKLRAEIEIALALGAASRS